MELLVYLLAIAPTTGNHPRIPTIPRRYVIRQHASFYSLNIYNCSNGKINTCDSFVMFRKKKYYDAFLISNHCIIIIN